LDQAVLAQLGKVMEQGTYIFPFQFCLNPELPSSICLPGGIGSFGEVNYRIKVEARHNQRKLARSWKRFDFGQARWPCPRPITVSANEKVSFLMGIYTGDIFLTGTLLRTSFTAGESIDFLLNVDNTKSPLSIKRVQVQLWQRIAWATRGNTDGGRLMVCESEAEGVPASKFGNYYFLLRLPDVLIPSCDASNIDSRYMVVTTVEIFGGKRIYLTMPIQIFAHEGVKETMTLTRYEGDTVKLMPKQDLPTQMWSRY